MDAEEVEVTSDSSILDYPGKKDGEVVEKSWNWTR